MKIILPVVLFLFCLQTPQPVLADECMEGDCNNGVGTGFTEEGKIYEGEWKDGYPHGKGKLQVTKGKVIEGKWERGELVQEKIGDNTGKE